MVQHIHALTPGDHYSPRTGSAVATVVHGLAAHTVPRPSVLVAQGTYADRYGSADPLEYPLKYTHGFSRGKRALDAALGRLALHRPWARRVYEQVVAAQGSWEPSYVIGHNAPQLMPLVHERHFPVLYVHNNLLDWYTTREANRVLTGIHRVICVSAYTAEQTMQKLAPELRARVRVVLNGVEAQDFQLPRPQRGESLRVGFIGRVIPRKGVHVLVDAITRLGRSDVELTIIGSSGFDASDPVTDYEKGLREMAAKIPGRVTFMTFQPRTELPALLSTFDVTVVPSIEPEACPLTVLEGMAAGSAVVASSIGGIPEVAGGGAQLFAPGDAAQLAEMIEALADAPQLVERYAREGRRRSQQMSWQRAADELTQALI